MRVWLAELALRFAEWLTPPAPQQPFFGGDHDPMTDGQWAGLIILHAEAVHDCDHTELAREAIGMRGPRGRRAAAS